MITMHEYKERIELDFVQSELNIDNIPENSINYGAVNIFDDRIGRKVGIPTIIITGNQKRPVFGLVAAIHGNEINGIPVIHQLFEQLRDKEIFGTIVAIPVGNVPGYLQYNREFMDGMDLNRIFPGKKMGTPSEEYAFHFLNRIVKKFDYLIDLHTASFGRINSHYVRADISHPKIKELLRLLHADIIVNTTGPSGTLRNASMDLNIPSLTIELGNPQRFQNNVAKEAMRGIRNMLAYLKIVDFEIKLPKRQPIYCKKSEWLRVQEGGILTVHPKLVQKVSKGDKIATLVDIYGIKHVDYFAEEYGIVIGKNKNPVVSTGDRILHLGVLDETIN